jgi:hypothetical protein
VYDRARIAMFNPPSSSKFSEEDISTKNRKFFSISKNRQEFYTSKILTRFFHNFTVHLDTIKFLFYPTDAKLNIPRKVLKLTLKLTLKMLLRESV